MTGRLVVVCISTFLRARSPRTDLGYIVMFAQFTQFLVKLANFILVRFTRHVLDHLTLARPSVRVVVRALRRGSRVDAARARFLLIRAGVVVGGARLL